MRRAAAGLLLIALFAGSAAFAGQGYRPHHHGPPRASTHHWHHDGHKDHHYRPAPRHVVVHRPVYPRYSPPRGYFVHNWRRGERLPVAFYQPRYVIVNYRGCGLRAPPHGYHWVRVDHDAVLAAIATGVILDVAFHVFG